MRVIYGLFVLIGLQIALRLRRANTAEGTARPRQSIAIAGLGLFFAIVQSASALDASPSAILTNPDRFDGKIVTMRGTITNLHETVSRRGNPYYTLDLSDGKRMIRVFSFGKAPCRAGAAIVEGTFTQVKQVGRLTFYNEVTAAQVTCP